MLLAFKKEESVNSIRKNRRGKNVLYTIINFQAK